MFASLLFTSLLAAAAHAQSTTVDGTLVASIVTNPSIAAPTGSYISYTAQITPSTSSSIATNTTVALNGTRTSTTTGAAIILTGVPHSSSTGTVNGSATSTSSGATASNTQPCNGYVEFCDRRYSNITYVCSHNSAFVKPGNVASNQDYGIPAQLNDGIRMSEFSSLTISTLTKRLLQSKEKYTMSTRPCTAVTAAATCSMQALWKTS